MRAWILVVLITGGYCSNNCHTSSPPCPKVREYFVSGKNGSDDPNCLKLDNFDFPCATLSYMSKGTENCSSYMLLDADIYLDVTLVFEGSEISIIGSHNPVTVHCQNNSGIVFYSDNIHLEQLNFSGCSATLAEIVQNSEWYSNLTSAHSSILFQYSINVSIISCSFKNHYGSAIALMDVAGSIKIHNSYFIGNVSLIEPTESRAGGIIITSTTLCSNFVSVLIENCTFDSNNVYSRAHFGGADSLDALYRGGAIDIFLELWEEARFALQISDSSFNSNHAMKGGAISFYFMGSESNCSVSLIRSNFTSNSADMEGGAVLVASDADTISKTNEFSPPLRSFTDFQVIDCDFRDNNASRGGGLAAYIKGCAMCDSQLDLYLIDSHWISNRAIKSGFALWLSSATEWYWAESRFRVQTHCNGSIFMQNTESVTDYDSFGAVCVDSTKLCFIGGLTSLINNSRSALLLQENGLAHFSGKVLFERNTGIIGGAVQLNDNTSLYIGQTSKLTFQENSAFVLGGAIYSSATKSVNCIFEFSNNTSGNNISFYSNTARMTDQSIFIRNADICKDQTGILTQLLIEPNNSSQVMFPPDSLELVLTKLPKETVQKDFEVALGEEFFLKPVNITDRFNKSLIDWIGYIWVQPEQNSDFKLRGPDTITFDMTQNKFFLEGIKDGNGSIISFTIDYYFYGEVMFHVGTTLLNVTVTQCNFGYQFSYEEKACTCSQSKRIECMANNSIGCVENHYWYGDDTDKPLPCPVLNCDYGSNKCPAKVTPYQTTNTLYCCVNDPNELCVKGRGGMLCSQCAHNYSFTFAAFKCVHVDNCKPIHTFFIFLSLVIFCILYSGAILVVLSVDLSVGSGFMYGIVYYFSVVTIYTDRSPLFSDWWFTIPLYLSTLVTQLDPQLLGTLDICFLKEWTTPLPHLMFRYATPVLIIALILLFILFQRYCQFATTRFFSILTYSPIHAICMLILFSYTSISCTSFKLLIPIEINGIHYLKAAPHVKYFSGDHVVFGIIALCVELFVSLPICILLLLAPKIAKHVDLVKLKLKPFIDEFQACYRPECRWFAGFYFVARLFVFLIHGVVTEVLPQHNSLLTAVNVIVMTAVVLLQPYQKKWLNLLDSLLLIDIVLVSSLSLPVTDQVSDLNKKIYKYLFPIALILFPICYLAIAIVMIIIKRSRNYFKRCYKYFNTKFGPRRSDADEESVVLTSGESSDDVSLNYHLRQSKTYDGNAIREPLLEESEVEQKNVTYGSLRSPYEEVSRNSLRLSRNRVTK